MPEVQKHLYVRKRRPPYLPHLLKALRFQPWPGMGRSASMIKSPLIKSILRAKQTPDSAEAPESAVNLPHPQRKLILTKTVVFLRPTKIANEYELVVVGEGQEIYVKLTLGMIVNLARSFVEAIGIILNESRKAK
jgi:hypothetical protein